MSNYCKECGQAVEDLTPAQVGQLLTKFTTMWIWEDYTVGQEFDVPGLGKVTIVHNSFLDNDGGDIKLVWQTRHGYVAVTGYYSSYSGSHWNDNFVKAERGVKEVVYFE